MEAKELESGEETSAGEYALGVTLTPKSRRDLLSEFRLMKDAIVDWASKRGDKGVLIVVNVVATTDIHEVFDDLLAKVYAQASSFVTVLQNQTLQVTLLDLDGNQCDQYQVEPPEGASEPGE